MLNEIFEKGNIHATGQELHYNKFYASYYAVEILSEWETNSISATSQVTANEIIKEVTPFILEHYKVSIFPRKFQV